MRRYLKGTAGIMLALALGSMAIAQGTGCPDVGELDPEKSSAAELLVCLVQMQGKIAALEAREPIPGPEGEPGPQGDAVLTGPQGAPGSAAIPANAVVAFAVETPDGVELDGPRDDPCPDGWKRYREADGRFILGVGERDLKERAAPFAEGGAETHTLTVDEMPRHDHFPGKGTIVDSLPDYTPGKTGRVAVTRSTNGDNSLSWESGGSKPHNNMPPYIALYFCKKEG